MACFRQIYCLYLSSEQHNIICICMKIIRILFTIAATKNHQDIEVRIKISFQVKYPF